MQLHTLFHRRLLGAAALTCTAALIPAAFAAAAMAAPAAAGTPAHPAAAALSAAGSATDAAARPQRRQLAVTTLSSFKVVLTATREPGPYAYATVTAGGYRHTQRGWKLIATKRIGRASGWSWYATDVCSLTVTQLKPEPSSAAPSDTITVSLLWGPAIGCMRPDTTHWR